MAQIIAGTPGGRDWTYVDANPFLYGYLSGADQEAFLMFQTKDILEGAENKAEIYGRMESGARYDGYGFKSALFKGQFADYDRYSFYCNKYGNVDRAGGIDHEYDPIINIQSLDGFFGVYDWGILNNFEYPRADLTWLGTSYPVFDDEEKMREYLASDDVDPEPYGGYYIGDPGSAPGEEVYQGADIQGIEDFGGIAYDDGMVRIFGVNDENYKNIAKMISKGVWGGNVGDAIISTKILKTPGALQMQPAQVILETLNRDITVSGQYLTKQYQKFELGSYSVYEIYRNFLDYTNTKIELYLPYCGVQELDPAVVVGMTLNLSCTIDCFSGNLVYFLEIVGSATRTIYSWNGNCALEIPITAEDYGQKVSNIISAGLTGFSTLKSGNAKIAAAETTLSVGQGIFERNYVKCGSISANNGFSAIQYPYLIITKPKYSLPSNYGHTVGFMCMKSLNLGSVSGFTKVSEVHLEGITGATDAEIAEIDMLLKTGVVF